MRGVVRVMENLLALGLDQPRNSFSRPSPSTLTWLWATQVVMDPFGLGTAQQGTGDDAVFIGAQLVVGELAEAGTEAGAQQARLDHVRAGQEITLLVKIWPGGEQFAVGDHVLVVDVPLHLVGTDRI